jgi:hypothetical protein
MTDLQENISKHRFVHTKITHGRNGSSTSFTTMGGINGKYGKV